MILEDYFLSWGHKLGLRRGADDVLLFVDGCAGRGADDVGNDGSPVIAARAAAAARGSINALRERPLRLDVIAIEKDESHYTELATRLSAFGSSVRVEHGTLEEKLPLIEREYEGAPALYFVDPFGMEPLKADVIQRILRGARAEVLLLFADQAALRHYGVIAARETDAERRHRRAYEEPTLFEEEHTAQLDELAQKAEESRGALEITRVRAREILDDAFGDSDWFSRIEATPKAQRRSEFIAMYGERLRKWGAVKTLPIPIVSAGGAHAYTLVHATKHLRGYEAMKEAVTKALKLSPLPALVVERMKASVASDLEEVVSTVLSAFAGTSVRWTEDRADPKLPSLRRYILQETNAFPFELDDLKARFKSYRNPGRVMSYTFPPAER